MGAAACGTEQSCSLSRIGIDGDNRISTVDGINDDVYFKYFLRQDRSQNQSLRSYQRSKFTQVPPEEERELILQTKVDGVVTSAKKRAMEIAMKAGSQGAQPRSTRHFLTKHLEAEVADLGPRADVALTGRLATEPEAPYKQKARAHMGLPCMEDLAEEFLVTVRCQTGAAPMKSRHNQDDYFFLKTNDHLSCFGVFDGHGPDGHQVAALARDTILRSLVANLPYNESITTDNELSMTATISNIITEAHHTLERATSKRMNLFLSGATLCIVVHDFKRRRLYIGWLGNCRCLAAERQPVWKNGERTKKKKLTAVPLTKDHTTSDQTERTRVLEAGGQLKDNGQKTLEVCVPGEDFPALPVTRCLGNLVAHRLGVIHEPDVCEYNFEEGNKEVKFIALVTDGVTEALPDEEIVMSLNEANSHNLQYGVEVAAERACKKWQAKKEEFGHVVDDITAIAFWL